MLIMRTIFFNIYICNIYSTNTATGKTSRIITFCIYKSSDLLPRISILAETWLRYFFPSTLRLLANVSPILQMKSVKRKREWLAKSLIVNWREVENENLSLCFQISLKTLLFWGLRSYDEAWLVHMHGTIPLTKI